MRSTREAGARCHRRYQWKRHLVDVRTWWPALCNVCFHFGKFMMAPAVRGILASLMNNCGLNFEALPTFLSDSK